MELHGVYGHVQACRDLAVRLPSRGEIEHLDFSRRQVLTWVSKGM
jgi:hypothetical protein